MIKIIKPSYGNLLTKYKQLFELSSFFNILSFNFKIEIENVACTIAILYLF